MSATSISTSAPMRDIGAQYAPVREVPFACVGRHTGRVRPGSDRCTAPCANLCRAYDGRSPIRGSTEEVLAAFFYGREDVIPEMFGTLLDTLYASGHNNDRLRHFIYYVESSHRTRWRQSMAPMGRELLEDLLANSPHREEQARRAACSSIKARIGLWNGTLSKLRKQPRWGLLSRPSRLTTLD